MFEEDEDPANKSFFSEIISSVSDVRFSPSGTHMISRDYLSVKLWDLRNERAPVSTFKVYLRKRTLSLWIVVVYTLFPYLRKRFPNMRDL